MANKQNRVAAVFAALADPTRRRILVRPSERGESPVTALAKPFHISPPGFSKHLRVPERARLIRRLRRGRWHLICTRAAGLKRLVKIVSVGTEQSLDKLELLLLAPAA